MTKSQLAALVTEKTSLSKKEVEEVINTIFESITSALGDGDKVELRGFGSFTIRDRPAKTGRNPKTGEIVKVPPKKVPFFKAGKDLKIKVNN